MAKKTPLYDPDMWKWHDIYYTNVSYSRVVTRSQTRFNRIKINEDNFDFFCDKERHNPSNLPNLIFTMKDGLYGAIPRTIITRSLSSKLGISPGLTETIEKYKKDGLYPVLQRGHHTNSPTGNDVPVQTIANNVTSMEENSNDEKLTKNHTANNLDQTIAKDMTSVEENDYDEKLKDDPLANDFSNQTIANNVTSMEEKRMDEEFKDDPLANEFPRQSKFEESKEEENNYGESNDPSLENNLPEQMIADNAKLLEEKGNNEDVKDNLLANDLPSQCNYEVPEGKNSNDEKLKDHSLENDIPEQTIADNTKLKEEERNDEELKDDPIANDLPGQSNNDASEEENSNDEKLKDPSPENDLEQTIVDNEKLMEEELKDNPLPNDFPGQSNYEMSKEENSNDEKLKDHPQENYLLEKTIADNEKLMEEKRMEEKLKDDPLSNDFPGKSNYEESKEENSGDEKLKDHSLENDIPEQTIADNALLKEEERNNEELKDDPQPNDLPGQSNNDAPKEKNRNDEKSKDNRHRPVRIRDHPLAHPHPHITSPNTLYDIHNFSTDDDSEK